MKKSLLLGLLLLSLGAVRAQNFWGLDKSPMDIAYYPDDFAHDRKFAPQKVGDRAFVRVIYSRPSKKEREVFGKMIPYGKVWRLGANEATEIKFYQDVLIQGKTVKAGTYALFAIPNDTEWTIILNSELDHWGAYSYKETNDVLRVNVAVKPLAEALESFSIQFSKGATDKEALLRMGWDKTAVELPISL
jgi:hypothetical protein